MPKCELCGGGNSFTLDDMINGIAKRMHMVCPGCFCDACMLNYIRSQMEARDAVLERESTGATLN